MTATTRDDATATHDPCAALLVGHLYYDVRAGRLHRLNEAARRLDADGIPFLGSEPGAEYLQTPTGELVRAEDLPLRAALRRGRPTEATLVFARPGKPPCQLLWSATPLRDATGPVAVLASVCCVPPPPDWHALAGLAHDLRTPFQIVRMLVDLLDDRNLPEAQRREFLQRLRSAAERALQIGSDLLDWCRFPVKGGRRVDSAWTYLEPFLSALVQEQSPAAAGKGLVLTADLVDVKSWQIYTDSIRLGRVVTNLLVNAVRYTPAGGQVTLTASWLASGPENERLLVLGIVDTGVGISSEEQESIFQPFERGRGGRGDSSSSGLGLAVVDQLVEELGLRREVSSEYGRGSIFRLLIPQRLLRFAPPPSPDPSTPAP
jgi:hypothetical protein